MSNHTATWLTLELPFPQDRVSAILELIIGLLSTIILLCLSNLAFSIKSRHLHRSGSVFITPNDFTTGLGHLHVLFIQRHFSPRGVLLSLFALTLSVCSVTAVIGISSSRCHVNPYSGLTEPRKTLCYKEAPVPTSGRTAATIAGRLRQLLVEEAYVNVRVHPTDFHMGVDDVTDMSSIIENPWGTVTNTSTCKYRLNISASEGEIGTADAELANLVGGGGQQPGPSIIPRRSRFGLFHDIRRDLDSVLYAKEVNNNGKAFVVLLHGYVREDHVGIVSDTKCAQLEFEGQGLKVIPFANTVEDIADRDSDIMRLIEVAWLGATLSEQIPRQTNCTRRNYTINQCTTLGTNSIVTLVALLIVTSVVAVVTVGYLLSNIWNPLQKVMDPYQLFATLSRENIGSNDCSNKKATQTLISTTDASGTLRLQVESTKPVKPDAGTQR